MSSRRILYVCQEITPYLSETDMSVLCRTLSQSMQERGNEIRTFMPRYGLINERRNQLHGVIRLSGMNLIINNNDHQLIIKVASIPSARVQIYFIDNEDYFQRRAMVQDESGEFFPDNDERAIFFARGVLETVKKLRWSPDVVHIHGWFSGITAIYLRNSFADDPLFKDTKIVISLYDDCFTGELSAECKEKIKNEGIKDLASLDLLNEPTYENLMKFVIKHADGVILESEKPSAELLQYIQQSKTPYLPYLDKSTTDYLDAYQTFYEKILTNE